MSEQDDKTDDIKRIVEKISAYITSDDLPGEISHKVIALHIVAAEAELYFRNGLDRGIVNAMLRDGDSAVVGAEIIATVREENTKAYERRVRQN